MWKPSKLKYCTTAQPTRLLPQFNVKFNVNRRMQLALGPTNCVHVSSSAGKWQYVPFFLQILFVASLLNCHIKWNRTDIKSKGKENRRKKYVYKELHLYRNRKYYTTDDPLHTEYAGLVLST